MSQAGELNVVQNHPTIPTSFSTNSGFAIPLANDLEIYGTGSITTSGAGNVVTISLTGLTNHNVLVGAGTATITNVPPSATSGVPLISQGSLADPAFGTAVVAGGGTGTTSFTAFAPVCGGTTSTNPFQSAITGFGTVGNVLTSTGSGSLPTWQVPASQGIQTIQGDTGSISGLTVRIFANQATLNAGASVAFSNSGTDSTFNVTDAHLNTFVGQGSGVAVASAGSDHTGFGYLTLSSLTGASSLNTAIGYQAGLANTSGSNNTSCGASALFNVTTGSGNTGCGRQAGTQLSTGSNNTYVGLAAGGTSGPQTGSKNTVIGANAGSNWTGTEDSNIYLGIVAGTASESNVLRIGTSGGGSGQVNKCFIAGIDGVNVGSVAKVVTLASDQLGTATITAGTGISVTPGANTITIATTGASFTWTDVTGATQTIAVENGYLTDRGGGVTYTLPATASIGDTFKIVGKLGLATITPNANQQLLIGSASGTVGATGTAVATNVGDCIEFVCTTSGASTVWRAANFVGNWTLS